jgi:GMP synthase PP-ATPase subunit
VGELHKSEVRRIAAEIGLPNAKKRTPPASASSASGRSANF